MRLRVDARCYGCCLNTAECLQQPRNNITMFLEEEELLQLDIMGNVAGRGCVHWADQRTPLSAGLIEGTLDMLGMLIYEASQGVALCQQGPNPKISLDLTVLHRLCGLFRARSWSHCAVLRCRTWVGCAPATGGPCARWCPRSAK